MDIETLSNEWIAAESVENKSGGDNHWSIDYVIDMSFEESRSDDLWEFIKCTYQKDPPDCVTGILAAGPLEDFLTDFGEKYFEEISSLAKRDKRFKYLLGGVWQNGMPDHFWEKICDLRGETW